MSIRLCKHEMKLLIIGLNKLFHERDSEKMELAELTLRIVKVYETAKTDRKKINFNAKERRMITISLISWRNELLSSNSPTEDLESLLMKFVA